ncbi:hypothetical protein KR074_005050, partial [Drosophila pseudoananassae]
IYVLVVNILIGLFLAIYMWKSGSLNSYLSTFPPLVLVTFYVRHFLSLFIVLYTALTRLFREMALKEVHPLLQRLIGKMGRKRIQINKALSSVFYAKCLTLSWLCIFDFAFVFLAHGPMDWKDVFLNVFLWNANNILHILPMGYFLVLWYFARGYDYVNHLVDQLITAPGEDLEELHRLWSFHTALSKAVLRVNRIYGPQMLAIRFDTFIFGVIQAYWGIFFTFGAKVPNAWLFYGTISYVIRFVDAFLIDHMSELLVKYQKSTKDSWSEINWSRETSDFVIYSNSSKLELWTCGLYKNNRSLWLQMTFSVFNYFLMLLQFHLVL